MFLESSIFVKRKTPANDLSSSLLPSQKRAKNAGYVPMRNHAKIVAQLATVTESDVKIPLHRVTAL